jgi:TolB-like protein
LLVLAVAIGATWWRSGAPPEGSPEPPAERQPPAASIAVLPFVDMSPEGDQEYLGDGIAEEILNLLAQVPGLTVIARTSSFSFKGQQADIGTIARRLNVAHVLEGSVRKSGDRVRVTAQLVNGDDGAHLWSQTFEERLQDVFATQDQIAGNVAVVLQERLLGQAGASPVFSRNPAHDADP